MSDWPYPALPGPGSNAVGVGAVGIASVGDIPIFDVHSTVISQYANSPRLLQLVTNFAGYFDQTANLDALYDLVLNLDTAVAYGLDRWGRVLGVNRVLQVPNQQFFGFAEAGDALPFGDAQYISGTGSAKTWIGVDPQAGGGPFYSGGSLTSNYAMSDQTYRQVLYAKAAANITSDSIPAINRILLNLFPNRGNCYVMEGALPQYFGFLEAGDAQPFGQAPFYLGGQIGRMQITYVFKFALSAVEQAIVAQSGVLPKPVGVMASVSIQP